MELRPGSPTPLPRGGSGAGGLGWRLLEASIAANSAVLSRGQVAASGPWDQTSPYALYSGATTAPLMGGESISSQRPSRARERSLQGLPASPLSRLHHASNQGFCFREQDA